MSEHKIAASEEPTLFGVEDAAEGTEKIDARNRHPGEPRSHGGGSAHPKVEAADAREEHEDAVQVANERADRLEAEMAELKALVKKMAATREASSGREKSSAARPSSGGTSAAARAKNDAAEALARAVQADRVDDGDGVEDADGGNDRGGGVEESAGDARGRRSNRAAVAQTKGGVPLKDGSSSGDSEARREARARVQAGDDASSSKEPASPSSAAGEPGVGGGEAELRKDPMMAHLLDSLDGGEDIGHYGRLVFAMVARHFLPHDEVLGWLMRDEDLGDEEARDMLLQVEQRDYSPPRRDRILQWQSEQEFAILPDVDDPDSGNVYKNLNFPKEIYKHIGHYREQKAEASDSGHSS